jgi:hypothetical protein
MPHEHEMLTPSQQALFDEGRKIVWDAADDTSANAEIRRLVARRVRLMIENGEVEFDGGDPIELALMAQWDRIDKAQGRAADAALAKTARGEIAFDIEGDPFVKTIVTLGKGRRKSWGYTIAADLREMFDLRIENHNRQTHSLELFEQDFKIVHPVLLEYGTVIDAINAGAFGSRRWVA